MTKEEEEQFIEQVLDKILGPTSKPPPKKKEPDQKDEEEEQMQKRIDDILDNMR